MPIILQWTRAHHQFLSDYWVTFKLPSPSNPCQSHLYISFIIVTGSRHVAYNLLLPIHNTKWISIRFRMVINQITQQHSNKMKKTTRWRWEEAQIAEQDEWHFVVKLQLSSIIMVDNDDACRTIILHKYAQVGPQHTWCTPYSILREHTTLPGTNDHLWLW